eukprot:1334517-Pyramimonas_sp.AAC.2
MTTAAANSKLGMASALKWRHGMASALSGRFQHNIGLSMLGEGANSNSPLAWGSSLRTSKRVHEHRTLGMRQCEAGSRRQPVVARDGALNFHANNASK